MPSFVPKEPAVDLSFQPGTIQYLRRLEKEKLEKMAAQTSTAKAVDNSPLSVDKNIAPTVDKQLSNDPESCNVTEPSGDSESKNAGQPFNATGSLNDSVSSDDSQTLNAAEVFYAPEPRVAPASLNASLSCHDSVPSPASELLNDHVSYTQLKSPLDDSVPSPDTASNNVTESHSDAGSGNDPVSFTVSGPSYDSVSRNAPEPFNDSEPSRVILTSVPLVREKDGFLEIRRGYSKLDWQVYQLMQVLTPHEFLVYFDLYSRSFGRVPQRNFCRCIYADIIAATKIKSKTTVKAAVKKLHEKGLVIPGKKSEGAGEQSYFSVFLPSEAKGRLGIPLRGKDPLVVPVETPPRDTW